MNESKNIFKSKTFWLNIIVGGLGVFTDVYSSVPGGSASVIGGLTTANIILRGITTKEVHVVTPKDQY